MNKYSLFVSYASAVAENTCYYHDGNVAHIMRLPKMKPSSKKIEIMAVNDKAALKQASEILRKIDLKDALLAALFKNDYPDDARAWICEVFYQSIKENPRWIKKFREKKQPPLLGDLFSDIL